MNFIDLPREKYEYYELHYTYETNECYNISFKENKDQIGLTLKRENLKQTFKKSSYDTLYQPNWIDCEAFGIADENGNLNAFLEISREEWNNSLRMTQLLVKENMRGKGFGSFLVNKVKEIAKKEDFRIIVLETQNCNVKSIDFYRSHGFGFGGANLYFYSNHDIEENEIMIEMTYLF